MDSDYLDFIIKMSGVPKGSVFEFAADSGFTIAKKADLFYRSVELMEEAVSEDILPKAILNELNLSNESDYDTVHSLIATLKKTKVFQPQDIAKKVKRVLQRDYLNEEKPFVQHEFINEHLTQYKGPIYMFDFETISMAIPLEPYSSPYQQVPYQYSIHVITDPSDFDFKTMKNVVHYE
ncbi:MAG: hypothetical protein DRP42_04060 [Tenericutes bacterium]|nr:MAG: hypothetical protein DRP42_04060 [Mycoplasmatota bacterium]